MNPQMFSTDYTLHLFENFTVKSEPNDMHGTNSHSDSSPLDSPIHLPNAIPDAAFYNNINMMNTANAEWNNIMLPSYNNTISNNTNTTSIANNNTNIYQQPIPQQQQQQQHNIINNNNTIINNNNRKRKLSTIANVPSPSPANTVYSDDTVSDDASESSVHTMDPTNLSAEEIRLLIEENNLKKQRLARKAALARASRQKKKSKLEQLEEENVKLREEIENLKKLNETYVNFYKIDKNNIADMSKTNNIDNLRNTLESVMNLLAPALSSLQQK